MDALRFAMFDAEFGASERDARGNFVCLYEDARTLKAVSREDQGTKKLDHAQHEFLLSQEFEAGILRN